MSVESVAGMPTKSTDLLHDLHLHSGLGQIHVTTADNSGQFVKSWPVHEIENPLCKELGVKWRRAAQKSLIKFVYSCFFKSRKKEM